MSDTTNFHIPSRPYSPSVGEVIRYYLKHTDREYLAKILPNWSPATDPDHYIGEALHQAVFIGDEIAVRMLLDAGVDPRAEQHCDPGFTPLLAASQYGKLEIARMLWQLVGPDGRFFLRGRNKTPSPTCLEVAARNGHPDVVAYFLDAWKGWSDDEKRRALRDAAHSWCDDVVALLLTKCHYEPDAVQDALDDGVRRQVILYENPTKKTCKAEDYIHQQHLVCRLIDAGANPDATTKFSGVPNQRLIHTATSSPHCIGALRGLLEKGADVNAQDSDGRTALHYLFHRSLTSYANVALPILLQYGASLQIADQTGQTIFHRVANTGTLEQLQICLAHSRDADAAIQSPNPHGETLLHYASAGGRVDVIEFLLSRHLDINSVSSNGWTPLMCALSPMNTKAERAMYHASNLLLQRGANAQVVTDEGWTPLHALATWPVAFNYQDPEARKEAAPLAKELISRGSPVDVQSRVIQSPSVTPEKLMGVWGSQMQKFVENVGLTQDMEGSDIDTTPLGWARRGNAMGIFDVIKTHIDSTSAPGYSADVLR